MNSKLVALLICLAFTQTVKAQSADWSQPTDGSTTAPAQHDDHKGGGLASEATSLGYDLSTDAGRKAFGDYMKTQRDTLATSQNIDLSTKEGRKAFGDYAKTQIASIASANNFDLSTETGRQALAAYLATNNELALLPPPRHDDHGPQQGGKDGARPAKQNGQAANGQQQGQQQGQAQDGSKPPCDHEGQGPQQAGNSAGSGVTSGAGSTNSVASVAMAQNNRPAFQAQASNQATGQTIMARQNPPPRH